MDEETKKRIEQIEYEIKTNLRSEMSGQAEIEELKRKDEIPPEPPKIPVVPEKELGRFLGEDPPKLVCSNCGESATRRVVVEDSEFYLCRTCAKDQEEKTLPILGDRSQAACAKCGEPPSCKTTDGYFCTEHAKELSDKLSEEEVETETRATVSSYNSSDYSTPMVGLSSIVSFGVSIVLIGIIVLFLGQIFNTVGSMTTNVTTTTSQANFTTSGLIATESAQNLTVLLIKTFPLIMVCGIMFVVISQVFRVRY